MKPKDVTLQFLSSVVPSSVFVLEMVSRNETVVNFAVLPLLVAPVVVA